MKIEEVFVCEYPKLLIKDLKSSIKKENLNNWQYDINVNLCNKNIKKTIEFMTLQIQGIIEQKPCDNIMIIRDSTGKAKLTCCENTLGAKTNLNEGMYCAVTGMLVREKGLPEISAIKLIQLGEDEIERSLFYEYWPKEVEDYQLFVAGAIFPEVKTYETS